MRRSGSIAALAGKHSYPAFAGATKHTARTQLAVLDLRASERTEDRLREYSSLADGSLQVMCIAAYRRKRDAHRLRLRNSDWLVWGCCRTTR